MVVVMVVVVLRLLNLSAQAGLKKVGVRGRWCCSAEQLGQGHPEVTARGGRATPMSPMTRRHQPPSQQTWPACLALL